MRSLVESLPAGVLALAACSEHGMTPPGGADDTISDADITGGTCVSGRDKIKFTEQQGCGNDGSVEFCVNENDSKTRSQIASISPSIRCAPGGGRAQCSLVPGQLLCTYPTQFPTECLTSHGAMTPQVWDDMCAIAGLPSIREIVPTFAE